MTAAGFWIAKDNTFVDPSTNEFGNFGEQEHQGVELNVFGEPWNDVRLVSGVTVMDAEQTETPGGMNDGNWPRAVPDLRVSITGEYDVPIARLRGLTLTGGIYHTGEQYADAGNTQEVSSWTRLDLGMRYRLQDPGTGAPWIARLTVENVSDRDYWDNAAFGLTPGTPRTLLLSLSARFSR